MIGLFNNTGIQTEFLTWFFNVSANIVHTLLITPIWNVWCFRRVAVFGNYSFNLGGWRRGGSMDMQAWFSNKKHLSGFDSLHSHGLVQIFKSMKSITNNK